MSWPEVDFESLFAAPSRNGVYKSKDHHGSGVPIVNMGELFAFNRIGNQPMSLIRMSDAEMDKSGLIDGDLLFGRRSLVEEGAGKCSIVYKPAGPLTFESSIIRVRLDRAIADPEFFFNYFRSPIGRSRIRAIVGGAAVKGIRGSDLKLIKVHVPPLDEQIAIRQVVALYDDLIATNQRRIALLEDAARRLYREWFVHLRFPGHESVPVKDGVPEGWCKRSMTSVADFVNGFAFKPEHLGEAGLPVVKIPELRSGITSKTPYNPGHIVPQRNHITTGDVLFSWSATLLVNEWGEGPALLNQHLFKVIPHNELHKRLVRFAVEAAIPELTGHAVGATMQHIRRSALDNHLMLVPDDATAAAFAAQADPMMDAVLNLTAQNRELVKARDLLLPKLMSGQLDVSGIALPDEVAA